jgi:hypothetical protein
VAPRADRRYIFPEPPEGEAMRARFKSFLVGLAIGAVVAFLLGMNYGRGAPLLSNPFAARDVMSAVKSEAGRIAEGAREKLHEATAPPRTTDPY